MSDKTMTVTEHLAELRRRILIAGLAFLAATLAAFGFAEHLAAFLMAPAASLRFVTISPPELFLAYLKISAIAGLGASSPIVLYQAWRFVRPALARRESRATALALSCGMALFAAGAAFARYVIVPLAIRFFLSYASPNVEAMLSVGAYLDFVLGLCLGFGAAFEIPVLCALLGAFGLLRSSSLAGRRGPAVLLVFVAAAALTPPDVVSQLLLALPMLGLFELSVLVLRAMERRRGVGAAGPAPPKEGQ